jgi:hemoglobin
MAPSRAVFSAAQQRSFRTMPMSLIDDLYETIGGSNTIEAAIGTFYQRVLEDEKLRHFFHSTDMAHLRSGQSMFVSMLLGGRVVYTGKDINAAHAHARAKGLTDEHVDAFLDHFRAALIEVGVVPAKAEKVMNMLEAQRAAVLNP